MTTQRIIPFILLCWLLAQAASTPAQEKEKLPADNFSGAIAAAEKQRDLGIRAHKQGDLPLALKYFTQSLAIVEDPLVLTARIITLMEQNQYQQAIEDLNRAVQLDPQSCDMLLMRASCYQKLNDINRALTDCTAVIDLDSTSSRAYYSRGVVWLNLDQLELALPDFQAAVRWGPDSLEAQQGLAKCYQQLDQKEQAARHWQRALQLDADKLPTYLIRADALKKMGDYAGAIRDLEAVLNANPNHKLALSLLAVILCSSEDERLRNLERSLSLATRSCEITAWKDYECLGVLAASYAQSGRFTEAIKWQQEAIRLAPQNERIDCESRLAKFQKREVLYPLHQPQAALKSNRK